MKLLTRLAAAGLLVAATLVTGAPAATAAPDEDFFVVDTQFFPGPADVVDAGGAFEGCWKVHDLWGAATELPSGQLQFEGQKRVHCPLGAKVTVYYLVTFDEATGTTSGTWEITDSTLTGATSGGGDLFGDGSACTPDKNSGGCILDRFSGDVS